MKKLFTFCNPLITIVKILVNMLSVLVVAYVQPLSLCLVGTHINTVLHE